LQLLKIKNLQRAPKIERNGEELLRRSKFPNNEVVAPHKEEDEQLVAV
jgi:hypothetical protein